MPATLISSFRRFQNLPVLLLILVNLVVGVFIFRDYGLSLDEPLFYGYADALGYAYTPAEWLKPSFDLENAYGPSPWDHRNRGPAYLLLARGPAHLLQSLGVDQASAWHLVNFVAFQFAVYFFYVFALRWMSPAAALVSAALFSTQPVLWEHAFINPKDPPFLTFFIISLELGFQMVDYLAELPSSEKFVRIIRRLILPAAMLGLTTSIRILGPLVAVLVGLYLLLLRKPNRLWVFIPYGLIAMLVMFVTWPYLWESPVRNFFSTLTFMAENPTELRVLFYGQVYRADDLPLRYLPALLLFTLTEPVWPLALVGLGTAVLRTWKKEIKWQSLLPAILWFAIPFLYVLAARPPMYDGFRHFMFIIPPLFILNGIAVDQIFRWLKFPAFCIALSLLLLAPALIANQQLHPYQYTYYNKFVGGTGKAAAQFETDYWLTCYKDAIRRLNKLTPKYSPTLFVRREGGLAAYYAAQGVTVVDTSQTMRQPGFGDYILGTSRANPGIQKYRDSTSMIVIKRQGAVFCTIGVNTP